MSRKILLTLKILVGAYLIFVGVMLLRTIQKVCPGNQEVMCGISAVFILVGSGYLIGLLAGAIKRSMDARAAEKMKEREPAPAARPVRDHSLFRTAPMTLLNTEEQESDAREGALQERTGHAQIPGSTSATVRLQKVGPDTMVWKK